MNTKTKCITYEDTNRVRTITFNRPDKLNAVNNELLIQLGDLLKATAMDESIAVSILTGCGKAFCAGQDLEEMRFLLESGTYKELRFSYMLERLINFPKPLIAAVNGLGVGIGMTLLAHCDIVLMSKKARLKTPFPQLGLAPEAGSSYSFPERLGWQNAAYALLSGHWFSAQECLDMGLAWRTTSPDELMSAAQEIAQEIAINPIPSLMATKKLLAKNGRALHAWNAHQREQAVYNTLLGAPANKEAVSAFVEKRTPDFQSIKRL